MVAREGFRIVVFRNITSVWRKRGGLITFFLLAVIFTGFVFVVVSQWSNTTLNDELQTGVPPSYNDDNITLSVIAASITHYGYYSPVDDLNQTITSDYGAIVRVNTIGQGWFLNICYIEVFVYNGTSNPSLEGWSMYLIDGYTDGRGRSSQYQVNIPTHNPESKITFQIRLFSTRSTSTGVLFNTTSRLNGRNFTYIVGYGEENIELDLSERALVLQDASRLCVISFLVPILWFYCPDSREELLPLKKAAEPMDKGHAASWIRFVASRIDHTETRRHNLIVEAQVLLLILGALGSFSLQSQFMNIQLLLVVILLAAPLLATIIFLMLGAEQSYDAEFSSTNPEILLKNLRLSLLKNSKLIEKGRLWIALGSFYALEMALMIVFLPVGVFQIIPRVVLWFASVLLILACIYYLAMNVYRRLEDDEEEITELQQVSTLDLI